MARKIPDDILVCSSCFGYLSIGHETIACQECKSSFPQTNEKIDFSQIKKEEQASDMLDKIKNKFKSFTGLYEFLIVLISPVYVSRAFVQKTIKNTFEEHPNAIALNLGSGNSNLSDQVCNIDLMPYPNVDMACDCDHLPIRDNSVDLIISIAVLEHVRNPERAIKEMKRVLKPGGKIFCCIPFIQGFHASPYDFSRRSREGMKELFKDFELNELRNTGGPTSGMLWILQEWIATIFSFGIRPLHTAILIVLMLLTWPIKFLDILLIHFPTAHHITSAFSIVVNKRPS